MVNVVLRVWLPLTIAWVSTAMIGCSDPGETIGPDAGAADTGDDDPCLGHPVPPDSGVRARANPVSGGGCNVANQESCVWSFRNDDVSCTCSFGTVALEQECRTDRLSCAPGLTCLAIQGDDGPHCHQVCDLSVDNGCKRLADADPANIYRCAPLGNGQGTAFSEKHGICVLIAPSCNPLSDQCDVNETCDFLEDSSGCIPAGTAALGEQCAETLCAKGGMCARIGMLLPAQCYQPCDLAASTCASGTCRDIGYPFGLCF